MTQLSENKLVRAIENLRKSCTSCSMYVVKVLDKDNLKYIHWRSQADLTGRASTAKGASNLGEFGGILPRKIFEIVTHKTAICSNRSIEF